MAEESVTKKQEASEATGLKRLFKAARRMAATANLNAGR